ncbi:MAG: hypothetical protein JO332_08220, partial [Planctomycetaceae bacterium]|nr:hypothetical protein [Planctomycetaceae bacterium]
FLLDWSLLLPAGVRLFLLAAGVAALGALAFKRILYPLGVKISDDDLALFVERHFPELNDRLISAIQLTREPVDETGTQQSPELVAALVADAEQATSQIDFRRVIIGKHVGKIALWAAAVLLLLGGGAVAKPDYARIYASRIFGGATKWPQRTHLQVLDFADARKVMARGDDLTIAVEYSGRKPSKTMLEYKFGTGEKGREHMSPLSGNRFQFTFTRVTGPFEFFVEGGDDITAVHRVDTVTPPSLDVVKVYYEYPVYMRMANTPADRPETSGNVSAPFGTKVRFEALANEDLKAAQLAVGFKGKETFSELPVTKTADGKPRQLSGGFTVGEAVSEYALNLTAENGLPNRDPIRFTIRGVEDRPPDIVVKDPLGDEFVTDLCERPLEIEVKDDHGVARIVMEYRILSQQQGKSKDWTAVEYNREQNSRDYGELLIKSESVLNIGQMGLQAGDHVELRFRAEDYKDVGGRNVRLSKVYKMSIVSVGTLEKELQDAIEKIKILLKNQKLRQETAWSRTGRLITNYGRLDSLTPEQQSEVRQAGLEQNDITSKLDGARKDIRQIQRRGVYNKIYNEAAAAKLQGALDELDPLVGVPGEATRDGLSRVAAAKLDGAARLKSGTDRTGSFREGQAMQSAVAAGIQKALDFLDKWSSYQEVIRIAREIKEQQERNNKEIKKTGGGK